MTSTENQELQNRHADEHESLRHFPDEQQAQSNEEMHTGIVESALKQTQREIDKMTDTENREEAARAEIIAALDFNPNEPIPVQKPILPSEEEINAAWDNSMDKTTREIAPNMPISTKTDAASALIKQQDRERKDMIAALDREYAELKVQGELILEKTNDVKAAKKALNNQ